MRSYISSNANRFYAAREAAFGQAAAITAANRFPAVRLNAHQRVESSARADKTGTRTFLGAPSGGKRQTAFEVRTYLTSWSGSGEPGYGPLIQAALGADAQPSSGLVVAAAQSGSALQTTAAHGLTPGSAVSFGNEIRFVTGVADAASMVLNAPFGSVPAAGAALNPTIAYKLANLPPSVTLYDFWDPISAISRLITGAAVDKFTVAVNGDFHEFSFEGPAADLLDSSSFAAGAAGLSNYPVEPASSLFDYSIVPGHLGEAWLGGSTSQLFTMTAASVTVKNDIQMRDSEFGSSYPLSFGAGAREVSSKFSLYALDDRQTESLYAASKSRLAVPAMLQLGQQAGQIMGIYMPQIVPEMPIFNDSEPRLKWEFSNNLAKGTANDEIYIAFA